MINILNLKMKKSAFFAKNVEVCLPYKECLQLFWNNEMNLCLERIAEALLLDLSLADSACLYRLWIEVLADLGDKEGLDLLQAHMRFLLDHSFEENPWRGLGALIHLELDEWEACELFREALKDSDRLCHYELEFEQRCKLRVEESQREDDLDLLKADKPWNDYFHWVTLARAYLLVGKEELLFASLSCTQKIFPDSPIEDQYLSHLHIDEQNLNEALPIALRLKQRYVGNIEFLFMCGYLQRSTQDFKAAVKTFSHGKELAPRDPDIFAELAYCHLQKSEQDVFSFHWQKAKDYAQHAASLYRSLGLPSTQINHQLSQQLRFEGGHESGAAETIGNEIVNRFWLLEITPSRYVEFAECEDEEISRLYRPVPPKSNKEDLFFLTAEDPLHHDSWRILAVYQMVSKKVWHPYERQQAALELIVRIESPVLIAQIDLGLTDRRNQLRSDDPSGFGMLELDLSAFDVLKGAILDKSSMEAPFDFSSFLAKSS